MSIKPLSPICRSGQRQVAFTADSPKVPRYRSKVSSVRGSFGRLPSQNKPALFSALCSRSSWPHSIFGVLM